MPLSPQDAAFPERGGPLARTPEPAFHGGPNRSSGKTGMGVHHGCREPNRQRSTGLLRPFDKNASADASSVKT